MNLTERDIGVVDFINTYKVATTKMLVDMHYNNYNVGTRRLKSMVDNGYLKRCRIATGEWVYYEGDGSLIMHNLMITKFIIALKEKGVRVKEVSYNAKIEGEEVDVAIIVSYDDKEYMLLVESELIDSFKKYKYENIFKKSSTVRGYNPIVVVIDNKPLSTDVNYTLVRLERSMENLKDLTRLIGVDN